jgi:hypothetical protein
MSPYAKAALSVLRLAAFGCIILSLALYSSDYFLYLSHRPLPGTGALALKGVPFLAGLMLYWKARPLAERLTRDLD